MFQVVSSEFSIYGRVLVMLTFYIMTVKDKVDFVHTFYVGRLLLIFSDNEHEENFIYYFCHDSRSYNNAVFLCQHSKL